MWRALKTAVIFLWILLCYGCALSVIVYYFTAVLNQQSWMVGLVGVLFFLFACSLSLISFREYRRDRWDREDK